MTSAAESDLTFVLGPPTEADERESFERYQAAWDSGDTKMIELYHQRMRKSFGALFLSFDGELSIMDDLFSVALETQVRIQKHFFGPAKVRGVWCSTIQFGQGDLLTEDGDIIAMPLHAELRDRVAWVLCRVLKREWVLGFCT